MPLHAGNLAEMKKIVSSIMPSLMFTNARDMAYPSTNPLFATTTRISGVSGLRFKRRKPSSDRTFDEGRHACRKNHETGLLAVRPGRKHFGRAVFSCRPISMENRGNRPLGVEARVSLRRVSAKLRGAWGKHSVMCSLSECASSMVRVHIHQCIYVMERLRRRMSSFTRETLQIILIFVSGEFLAAVHRFLGGTPATWTNWFQGVR